MKNGKLMSVVTVAALSLVLAACGSGGNKTSGSESTNGSGSEKRTLKVAALESAYGADMWKQIKAGYEKVDPNVTIELTTDKKLEEVISPDMKAGNFNDVILLATGREAGLTETFIKDKNLEDLTDVMSEKIPGEEKTPKDKLIPGFLDTMATNPYNDGKNYLAPMFYSPTGLFYNAGLFKEKGWEVPKTWDEMWALGDKAKAEGISLFTYPTTGYLDGFFFSLLDIVGGPDFYNDALSYKKGTWSSDNATKVFDIATKLASYTSPQTPANANDQDYKKNQQMILDNKALFMPNGTWVTGEMKDAPRADGFQWGMTALPALETGKDQYAYTFFEQMWMPTGAKNKDDGKKFIAWMYSDAAADIFSKAGAVQPIEGMSSKLDGENKVFYSIYDNGAKAALGSFQTTATVEGVNLRDTLYGTYDSIVSGQKTEKEWQEAVVQATDKLRDAMK